MKRLTLIILGVLLCTPLYSDMNPYIAGVPVSGGCQSEDGLLLVENCTGSASSGWTDTEGVSGGDVDWGNSISGDRGDYSLKITSGTSDTASTVYASWTPVGEVWFHTMIRFDSIVQVSEYYILMIREITIGRFALLMNADGYIKLSHGSVRSASATTQLAEDQWCHIWVRYKKSTGSSDGEADLYISFTATRPASPEISITNGNSTADLSQLILQQISYEGNQYTVYFDQIYLDDEEISTVCD